MGWWKIDPKTGEPLKDSHSAVSTPEVAVLNAIPGVDDDEQTCYLGDGPWDMASTLPAELIAATDAVTHLTRRQIRDLLLRKVVPASLNGFRTALFKVIDAFWADIDSCYQDD